MPDFLVSFLQVVGLQMPFLVVGLLLVRLVVIPLKQFMGVYLLLVGGNVALTYFLQPEISILWPALAGVASVLLLVALTGALGTKFQAANYETVLVTFGLFPWYLGPGVWFTFITLAGITLAIWTSVAVSRGFKKINHKRIPLKYAKKDLSPEDFTTFARTASVIFAFPVLIGAMASAVLAAF